MNPVQHMPSSPLINNPPRASDSPTATPADAVFSLRPSREGFSEVLNLRRVLERARALRGVLRLKPFDTSTVEGRSQERYRRAALTSFTSVLIRAVTILTGIVTVRLTVRYLGTERYGLWMTITSVVCMMSFADLGIGNGLLNSISESYGKGDRESARRYVSSAFLVLFGIAVLLTGAFAISYPFVNWPRFFNVSSTIAAHEAGPAVFVFLVFFALNMPLDVVQRVQTGYQEGFVTNLWSVAGNLTALGCLLTAMHVKAGLPWLLLSVSGGQLLGVLGNWSHEFGWVRPWLVPSWRCWDSAAARKIMGTGVMFLVLNVSGIFTATVDNVVVAQILGPGAVTQYAVPMRLFLLVVSVSLMLTSPLWPAYGEAMVRGDVQWVRRTLARSLGYSVLIFGPIVLGLALFGKVIVHIWVGPQIQPSYAMLLGMAIWAVIAVFGNALATFFNGTNFLKVQVLAAVLMAITNLILKIVFAEKFGLWAIPWATVLSSVPSGVLQTIYAYRLLTKSGVFVPKVREALPLSK